MPTLRRAGEIFRGLTLGAFPSLSVDYDQKTPTLVARRATGGSVGVEGMSDGTRDQLYLALRLASLEDELSRSPPLPFLADDLFVTYDDVRTKAGFSALCELADKTQVIYLTHHDHLVEIAGVASGGRVNVIRL